MGADLQGTWPGSRYPWSLDPSPHGAWIPVYMEPRSQSAWSRPDAGQGSETRLLRPQLPRPTNLPGGSEYGQAGYRAANVAGWPVLAARPRAFMEILGVNK